MSPYAFDWCLTWTLASGWRSSWISSYSVGRIKRPLALHGLTGNLSASIQAPSPLVLGFARSQRRRCFGIIPQSKRRLESAAMAETDLSTSDGKEWLVCPVCGTKSVASCPFCSSPGTDFAQEDLDFGRLFNLSSSGISAQSCGPQGCSPVRQKPGSPPETRSASDTAAADWRHRDS
jgi:hypothetical protein